METISVAVRLRPSVTQDQVNGTFWKVEDNQISPRRLHGSPTSAVSYVFDHVFDDTCSNARVYNRLTKDIIHAVVEGFNGTVFAYGQTSSGKTFTMNGSEDDPGIIPVAVRDVFNRIHKTGDREFVIRVSYMEIYNEEINDLLVINSKKLPIHESLERGFFVAGLREETVNNAEEVLKLLEDGEVNRHFGETNMNVRSSRSHTIFRMVIESKGKQTDSIHSDYSSSEAIRVSTLNLVDLAGSERIAKTGADGVRLKEGKHINKSLMVLGNVINKLSEGTRGHIPYRDSKLTRILQSAIGGNAKTSIICTVAPEEVHIEETKGTLQFATRAKRITNCAQVNEILTDAALLKRQKLEIEELRQKLQGSQVEELEQEISKLRDANLKYELQMEKLAMELKEERKLHKEADECIKEQQLKIENLSKLVDITEHDRKSPAWSQDQEDNFGTPRYRATPSFVFRRSSYSAFPDSSCSPFPGTFSNVADEEAWMKLNKGYVADLDSISITPATKVQSVTSVAVIPHQEEIQNLKKDLKLATKEKLMLKREHADQVQINHQLKKDMIELQREMQRIHEIPKQMRKSLATFKDICNASLSNMQVELQKVDISHGLSSASFEPRVSSATTSLFIRARRSVDEKSFAEKLISSTREACTNICSTLESHYEMAMALDSDQPLTADSSLLHEHCKVLCDKLNNTIASVASKDLQNMQMNGSGDCRVAPLSRSWSLTVLSFTLFFMVYVISLYKSPTF